MLENGCNHDCFLQYNDGEQYLGKFWPAHKITQKGIDPCGENGEFHTLVLNCPLFSEAIELPAFTKITYENYCFIVWEE
jgi:diphthamide synthase (EF-2-diphthine--ammonia ligase)